MPELRTIAETVALIKRELQAAGVDDAVSESRRLLQAAAGLPADIIIRDPDRHLNADQMANVDAWVRRRRAREPLARIEGHKEFYGRPFALSQDTLEPRADTEILIDVTLELVRRRPKGDRELRVLDVGTGSGCILVTLLTELPDAVGVGSDISSSALETANHNAVALGVGDRATWVEANYLQGIDQHFDVVVSNPPYVRSTDLASLQPEVRQFDPIAALDGRGDGLDAYRQIALRLNDIVPAGICVVEVAGNDADRVAATMIECAGGNHLRTVGVWPDLTGMQRCVALETL